MPTLDIPITIDNTLYSSNPSTNYGSEAYWALTNLDGVGKYRVVAKPDLSSIPAGAIIDSATLKLYCYSVYGTGVTYAVGRILSANSAWTESGSCWGLTDGVAGHYWAGNATGGGCQISGTDYDSTLLASGTPVATASTWESIEFDLEQFALMRADNYGFVHGLVGGSGAINRFYRSSDYATEAERPYLQVVYHMPAAAAAMYYQNFLAGGT